MKIRNKKTGEIVEVKDPKELAKYGIKLPKAKMGVQYMDGETGANLVIPEQDSFNPEGNQLMLNTFNKYGISPTQPFQGVGYNNQLMQNPFGYPTENINVESFGLGDNKLEPLKTNTKDNFSRMPEKVKINQKAPKLFPVTGNKYFNRGFTYLNQAIKHGSNINNPNPDMSPDYNGIMSPLQTFSEGGFNQNGFNNIMQGVAAGVNTLQSGINFGKGALDIIGSQNQNRQIQNFENQLYTQSVFNDAMQTVPQDYIYNRNALAENGKLVKQFGGNGKANVEIEDRETAIHPSGYSERFFGKTHSEGGIPLSAKEGTKIASEKLGLTFKEIEHLKGIGLPKAEVGINITQNSDTVQNPLEFLDFIPNKNKKMSFADMTAPFQTKKQFEIKEHKFADPIQKNTADIMIQRKDYLGNQPFALQEHLKIGGHFGKDVQMNALEDYKMEYGGMKKAQTGMMVEIGRKPKDPNYKTKAVKTNIDDIVKGGFHYIESEGNKSYYEKDGNRKSYWRKVCF